MPYIAVKHLLVAAATIISTTMITTTYICTATARTFSLVRTEATLPVAQTAMVKTTSTGGVAAEEPSASMIREKGIRVGRGGLPHTTLHANSATRYTYAQCP